MDCRQNLFHWIALHRIPGVGPRSFHALLNGFGDPVKVFNDSLAALQHTGLANKTCQQILDVASGRDTALLSQVSRDLEWLAAHDATVLTLHDERYPCLLKEISGCPPLLYVLGDVAALSVPQIAMVGARNATQTGCQLARQFAADLSRNGLLITSGMALGIDAAGHRGALETGGKTVAVLGTGLDVIYPVRHRELAGQISQHGALVSEFPLGTQPRRENFPRRNRLISGLSMGVLVVEAAIRSGSLITAQYALEQSREVFAVPGSIHNPLSRGSHALIRQGAKLVETSEDILEELGGIMQLFRCGEVESPAIVKSVESLSQEEQDLLNCVGFEPTPVDVIIDSSGMAAGEVSAILIGLELKGVLESAAGGYQRISG